MHLYDHQKRIIADDPKVTGLWLGTGSGKTRTALMLARGRTMVICPKTQKEDRNWERELESIGNPNGINLVVVSKEAFRRDVDIYIDSGVDTLIVDEAHTCLGVTPNVRWVKKQAVPKTSQLFEELDRFVQRTQPTRLYLCTATIMKSPMTVFGVARILGFDWNFYEFREAFYVRLPMPGREVWQVKKDSATKDRLAQAVRKLGYVGRLDDFFDVPEQTFKTIPIELSAKQQARIKDMKLEYPDPLVRVGKIHQIENGVLSGDEFNAPESFPSAKIDAILDLSVEYPRMVVFAKYTAQIAQIASALRDEGKKVLALTGETKDRGGVILEANRSPNCIFIVQAQISAGWQLGKTEDHPEYHDYNCMVFASRTYSFVDYDQGLGRILRSDNIKKNLYVNLVVKGGVDEAVDRCLATKSDFNEALFTKKVVI